MIDTLSNIYCKGMSPEELANKFLQLYYDGVSPSIPIDPFKIMRDLNMVYQFMDFEELEGIYLVPDNVDDIAVVGINYNRPITRKRFTAAHELCHHIKDKNNETCPINSATSNVIERYAERFAAALLMPIEQLQQVALTYKKGTFLSLDDVLIISDKFGVSFRACALRLAYTLHLLDFENSTDLNQKLTQYKPDWHKKQFGIDIENIELLKQAVNSYPFFFKIEPNIVWYKFKNEFIYHENRLEGVDISEEEVAEIVTDLRLHKSESEFCNTEYENIIQVAGHVSIYDYIFSTEDKPSVFSLLKLHQMLFQFAPCPEEAGKTRTDNNFILGSSVELVDSKIVVTELMKLQPIIENLIDRKEKYSISEYIGKMAGVHHRMTQIHPFNDGNGRCTRAFLNWMLRLKNLPPIYIKASAKEAYYQALVLADEDLNYNELARIFMRELFRTMIEYNKSR